MHSITTELDIVKQLFENLSSEDIKKFLTSLKTKEETAQKIAYHKASNCPHCGGLNFVKNGTKDKAQRYICKDCHKTFADRNNTILFSTKKDIEIWQKYIHCLVEKYSLRKTAQICGISLPTAFSWRHKILDALQNMMSETTLDGVVEADETFLPLSFKGNHKNFNLPRLAKKRGSANTRRGLSKELVCIPCIVDLSGKSVAKISNLSKPNINALSSVINGKIAENSVLVTDSLRAYLKVANDMILSHIRIPPKKHQIGTFNIQTINSYHSRLKTMIKARLFFC